MVSPGLDTTRSATEHPSVETLKKLAQALDVHVFDLKRLRRKHNDVDKLTPHLYMALGKIVQYALNVGFLR